MTPVELPDTSLRERLQSERGLLFLCLVFFACFLFVTLFRESFAAIDVNVNLWVVSIQTGSLTVVAKVIAYGFDTTILLAASLLVASYLFYRSYRTESVLLLGAMGGDAFIIVIAKSLVRSSRPLNGLMVESGFSFPSGHVAGGICFCGLLTYFAWQHWKDMKVKALFGVVLVAVSSTVGFDRIYLNVHWFSDVLGGYLLGISWLTFSILSMHLLVTSHVFQFRFNWKKDNPYVQ